MWDLTDLLCLTPGDETSEHTTTTRTLLHRPW